MSLVMGDKWRGRVSERTAGAVRDAAEALGYRPNLAARNLRLGRTRTALLVVPSITNEYFARVYTGAARVAGENGFGVVLYPSPEGVGPARDPFGSAQAALDGIIASSMAADALAALADGGLPLVMLDADPAEAGPAATVNLAIADGMRQIARHLLGLGHRPDRIAHLAAALGTTPPAERSAVAFEDARHATERLLARPGPAPPPSSATTTSSPSAPAKPCAGSGSASPTTSLSPATTTSPSPPPSNPNSPPSGSRPTPSAPTA